VAAGTAVVGVVAAPASATPSQVGSGGVHIYRSHLTAAQIARYSKNANKRVIVLLRNQIPRTLGGGAAGLNIRSAALARAQAPIANELRSLRAANITQYHFINAVSGTLSSLEVKRLKQNPAVRAVVPDRKVLLPKAADTGSSARSSAVNPVNKTKGICGTAKKPLLEPEALRQMNAVTFHHGIDGKGVKIAVFPDGLDPNLKDFIRKNGSHAIFDYRDFTGDGPNAVTSGGEAFGDASSLISQGRFTYDLSKEVNPNLPLPKNCDIRIRGVAPGASLAVMKVFSTEFSTNSTILQGLDWAVSHDHVNIISQSFGGNPIPQTGTDPVSVFDQDAVKHGITVLASTGDAGITNTVGSPASVGNGVIGVGGTSSFRSHAQVSEHGYQLGHDKGWENNNVATISSTGFTNYGPNTVDITAVADGGWADCSPNINRYVGCANIFGADSGAPPIELFGGTSESCPLTAGVAALVIQAYRSTHKGTTPAPRLVKRILMSTATDLGAPAQEQGAGQVNAARAVALARSIKGSTAKRSGHNLLVSPNKIETTAAPNTTQTRQVTVTNDGSTARRVTPVVKHFSAPATVLNTTVNLDSTSANPKTFTYWLDGSDEPYVEKDFTVPAGNQRLDVRFGFPQTGVHAGQEVFLVLFDPHGKLAQDSDPQGPSGFGEDDVQNPIAGTWRAILFSRPFSDKYSGPISLKATVQKNLRIPASVSPTSARIPAGAARKFTVKFKTAAQPGDRSAAVHFGSGIGALPILTRATIPVTAGSAGRFSGTLTTGNGRMALPSQELPYQFDVPANVKDIDVDLHVVRPGYSLIATLIPPNRDPVDSQSTLFVDETQSGTPESDTQTAHLSWANPNKGRWEIDIATLGGSGSGRTSSRFHGTVAFNTVHVTSSGVPHKASTVITAGQQRTAHVTVTNTGASPEIYYIDPRENNRTTYSLGFFTDPNGTIPLSGDVPQAAVPPETSSFTMVMTSPKKIDFTVSPAFGTPEILSTTGKTAVAGITGSPEASEWGGAPNLIGPFSSPAPSTTFSAAAFGTTHTINDDIAATGGNLWDSTADPNGPNQFSPSDAVVVPPGQSTTLTVQIQPNSDEVGEVISGHLSVQTWSPVTIGSDHLVNIPYKYTVGPES
jgi:Subtilase family